MRFVKLTHKDNHENYMYFVENKFSIDEDLFSVETFTHENIPLSGLSFIFNTDTDSHFYIRQILFHRLKMGDIVKTEENENILLDIVPDYFISDNYQKSLLIDKFSQMRETCKPLIRKMYEMLISFIRVVDDSILYMYYDDISRLRNIESSEILNYLYAFYNQEITDLYKDIVIPEYIDKYYKVKSVIFDDVLNEHENTAIQIIRTYPQIRKILDKSEYIKSNNPELLSIKESLDISDGLYNSLFITTFERQKQYL